MGYNQVYKGNPELKRYYLVNNFSGGVNNVDVDDMVADNEFRILENVELSTKGMVQNRKGWGSMSILNYILDQKGVTLDDGTYYLVKVIENTGGIWQKLEEYDTIENFLLGTINLAYKLRLMLVVDNKIYILTISRDNATQLGTIAEISASNTEKFSFIPPESITTYTVHSYDTTEDFPWPGVTTDLYCALEGVYESGTPSYWKYYSGVGYGFYLPSESDYEITGYKKVKTNISSFDYSNTTYFAYSDVNENFEGVVEYNFNTDKFRLINGFTGYKPYADTEVDISVSGGLTGFNVLRDNPLFDLTDRGTGLPKIVGLVLTNTSYEMLTKVPTSGAFLVNVYISGGDTFKPEYLQLVFKDQYENIMEYTLTAPNGSVTGTYDFGAYFSYKISNLNVSSTDFVTIDVKAVEPNIVVTGSAITLAPFLNLTAGTSHVAVENDYKFYKKNTGTDGYQLSDFTEYVVEAKYADVITNDPNTSGIFDDYKSALYNNKYFEVYDTDAHNFKIWYWSNSISTFVYYALGTLYESTDSFIPYIGALIKNEITADNVVYYRRWDDASGTATDFDEIDYTEDFTVVSLLSQYFEIGTSDAAEIEGIDLSNVKIFGLPDRLIYYKGNTVWFSELWQFDYLPNTAYMLLPLAADDEITNISFYRGAYVIFTKKRIYKFSGTSLESYNASLTLVNDFIGCIAPKSVRSINNSLYFMSPFGLYSLFATAYTDGLENVRKVDKKVEGTFPISETVESIMYDNQYWLLFHDNDDFDTLKNYFEVTTTDRQTAYVMDSYSQTVPIMAQYLSDLFTISDGLFYKFDKGYTDLMPDSESDDTNYTYTCKIKTVNYNFGYPTHDKKYKSVFIKTYSNATQILYFKIRFDDYLKMDSTRTRITVNELGQIQYEEYIDDDADTSLELDTAFLDNFDLDFDPLDDNPLEIHKIIVPYKGKSISFEIEQKTNGYFGIVDIGFLYKLGKVKEQR